MCPHFSLPGIKSIEYLNACKLSSNIVLQAVAGIVPYVYLPRTPLVLHGESTCEVERTNEGNGTQETLTLQFQTGTVLPEDYPLAFVITDVNGNTYLAGQREQPFPLIDCKQIFGNPAADRHTLQVEVKFSALRALFPCKLP